MVQTRFKRGVSLLLAVLFVCLGCFGVFAEGEQNTQPPAEGSTQSGETQTGEGQGSGSESGETGSTTPEQSTCTHEWGDWVDTLTATCTTDGSRSRTCKKCNKVEYEAVKASGHKFKVSIDDPASCTEKGLKLEICEKCGEQQREERPALGHVDENKDGKCDRCKISLSETEPTNPTDPATGDCKNGHDYEEKETPATCTEKGKIEQVCKRCGDRKLIKETPKLGHDTVTEPQVDPTCQAEGKTEKRYCKRCNEVFLESKTLKKVDHEGVAVDPVAPTCQKDGSTGKIVCKWCKTVLQEPTVLPKTGHDYQATIITPATCTSGGLNREECKVCKDTRLIQTPALEHKLEDTWIVEATCTTPGVRVKKCVNTWPDPKDPNDPDKHIACDYQTNMENVPALGHDPEKTWTVDKAPTCTAAGTKSHHCSRCGKAFDVTSVPKSGHDYKITVKPATTKKDGRKTYLCKVCGKNVTKVIYQISSIKLSKSVYVCDNKAKKPTVVVKNTADKKLTKDKDYKVTYEKGRKKVGTYTVKVEFLGDYKGSKTLKFTIKLGKTTGVTLKKLRGSKVTVSFDKVKGAQKYCIYYATSKNGDYQKLVNTTKTTYTTGAFKAGKTYYFKVRAVTKDTDGKNQFGDYSAVSKIKL